MICPAMHDAPRFEVHIVGLETFAAFVAVLRGEDAEKLIALTTRLQHATDDLQTAVVHNTPSSGGD